MEAWIKFLKPYAVSVCVGLLCAMTWPLTEATKIVEASPIKNWTSNEYVTYTDLNNNFNHLHANLGHGHGPIVTANDIAANAGIRPEQTTFGAGVLNMVHVGNYRTNPDGGAVYLPTNARGSLAITVTESANGFFIAGVASSDRLADGGTYVYDVFVTTTYGESTNRPTLCANTTNDFLYPTPLFISFDCYDITATAFGTSARATPKGVMVQIYSNKVN